MKPDNRGAASMQQVADWLEKLGLGQYAQRFAENDISFVILPDLTDQDLEDWRCVARSSAPPGRSYPSQNLHREYSVSLMKSTACAPSPTRMATKR
jgi:hypothetical protein